MRVRFARQPFYFPFAQQLSIEDRDQLMKEWAEESKNMKGSHWITNMIARGIPVCRTFRNPLLP
jgi:hypothetical protein